MIESVLSAISPPERRIKFDRVLALNPAVVQNKISQFLEGDCAHEDITTLSTVQMETVSEASIVAREPLVFAAEQIVPHCFGETCHVELRVTDGAEVPLDEKTAVISGPETEILARDSALCQCKNPPCGQRVGAVRGRTEPSGHRDRQSHE